MSRLRHAKGLPKMAGALSGVHRLQVDKPHPFKPIEERKHGGKTHHVDGHAHHHKLGRKRGGSVKKNPDRIIGQDGKPSSHGTDATPDRGMKLGTPVQDTPMAGTESGYGGKFAHGKGHVEDSLRRGGHAHHDGEKVGWLHKKHGGKLTYQERKHLKSSSFVFPGERKYPLPDESHGRNALARVSQFGSPSEKAKVRAAVHKKFPNIGK